MDLHRFRGEGLHQLGAASRTLDRGTFRFRVFVHPQTCAGKQTDILN
jgi:hypothetical protein